ncbi:DUF3558 domain-containing protein [Nocardia macrotermitis]|nr:hypothetical protein [Nocardia macrotermitis]
MTSVIRCGAAAVFTPHLDHFDGDGLPRELIKLADLITVDDEQTYSRYALSDLPTTSSTAIRKHGNALGRLFSKHAGHFLLWDPSTLADAVWRQVGIDPATLSTTIGGFDRVEGFKRCGGQDNPRTLALDVWSQLYTEEDFRRKHAEVEFTPISIADRPGLQFRPITDRRGDQCHLLFPARQGSFGINVLRLNPRTPSLPATKATEAAAVIVPLLPR